MDVPSLTSYWNSALPWLSKLLWVVVILFVGYIIAAVLRSLVTKGLRGLGLDKRLSKTDANNIMRRLTDSPSRLVGKLVYWATVFVAWTVALSFLNVPVFNQLITAVYLYIPNVLAAILIFAIALGLSVLVASAANRLMSGTLTGKIIATVLPVLIITISVFAILVELNIAFAVVMATYIALVGSLALGFGLSFGLGGVDVSKRLFDEAYKVGQENAAQVKKDIQEGVARGKAETDNFLGKKDKDTGKQS